MVRNNNVKFDTHKTFGLSLGSSANGTIYVQSIMKTLMHSKKILSSMQVLKFDSLDFTGTHDYILLADSLEKVFVEIIDSEGLKKKFQIKK